MQTGVTLFPPEYHGRAFVARFGQQLAIPGNAGFDLLSLRLDDAHEGFFCNRFLSGLGRCIDVLVADNGRLYVLEYNQQTSYGGSGGGSVSRLTEIRYTIDTVPRIAVDPIAVDRSVDAGHNLPDETLTVWNSGIGTLNFNVSIDGAPAWVQIAPEGGQSTGPANPSVLTVSWDTAGLTLGTYSATIRIAAPGAANTPLLVPVSLRVKTVLPDFDADLDVDQSDFAHLQVCLSPATLPPPPSAGCENADLIDDQVIDVGDFHAFLVCFSGPQITPVKTCDDALE
jgi:hypothetical protein